jgi:hypothetical protein
MDIKLIEKLAAERGGVLSDLAQLLLELAERVRQLEATKPKSR